MTITVDELIASSFVISIDENRYRTFTDAFTGAGFRNTPKWIEGFRINSKPNVRYRLPELHSPIMGNSFTHASIVKYGKTFGMDFVCIFEDDAFPCRNIIGKLESYLTGIPDNCGILKLGLDSVYGVEKPVVSDGKYICGLKTWGCHAYIVFRRYYDEYFKRFEKNILCDYEVFNGGREIYITAENLIIQRNIASKNTAAINRLRNMNVKSFDAETIDIGKILEKHDIKSCRRVQEQNIRRESKSSSKKNPIVIVPL